METEIKKEYFSDRKIEILASIYDEPLLAKLRLDLKKKISKYDKSLKANLDPKLKSLCEIVNKQEDLYTTSCCSGRLQIYGYVNNKENKMKHNGHIIFATHSIEDFISADELLDLLSTNKFQYGKSMMKTKNSYLQAKDLSCQQLENVIFIFEPILLHVVCRTLKSALQLLKCCRIAGIKKAGIMGFKPYKGFHVSINGADRLHIPLQKDNKNLYINKEQLNSWLNIAKEMMSKNDSKIILFETALRKEFE